MLTTGVSNYEKSGQNDPDKSERDFTGWDLALEYFWLTLDAMNMLTDFGTKPLPGEAAAEDGSPPADNGGGDEDTGADIAVTATPAPKRRRSAQRPATRMSPPPHARGRGGRVQRRDEDLHVPRHPASFSVRSCRRTRIRRSRISRGRAPRQQLMPRC